MEKTMTRFVLGSVVLALGLTFGSIAAFAGYITCPLHPSAGCWQTGRVSDNGLYEYKCSCGDTTWAR
jgi:uncharacterized membrane protein YccF (DUF307 family)